MKKNLLSLLIILLGCVHLYSQPRSSIILTGASFGVPENGWFEMACDEFNVKANNKAVSAESIKHTAVRMFDGNCYTHTELDEAEAFVIMHVHEQDVAATESLKEDHREYTRDAVHASYPVAYDYVIKKYREDCYNLREDPDSRYYGTENGKPAVIVFCTHWHDARTTYNEAIRVLADRWGYPLVDWANHIGFTKNDVDENGQKLSIKYCHDTESLYGEIHGWHPAKGQGQYIQKKMAQVFMAEMENILGVIPVSATVWGKNNLLLPEQEPYAYFNFTGVSPWNLTYAIGEKTFTEENITENPWILKIEVPEAGSVAISPVRITGASGIDGTGSGKAVFGHAKGCVLSSFDTYVHGINKNEVYMRADSLELKTATDGYSREIFISFDLDPLEKNSEAIMLRVFFGRLVYSVKPPLEEHVITVSGNTESYTSVNWNNKPENFMDIASVKVEASEEGSFINWDVTDWVKEQIEAQAEVVTFRLKVTKGGTGLLKFPSMESAAPFEQKPALVTDKGIYTGIVRNKTNESLAYMKDGCIVLPEFSPEVLVSPLHGMVYKRMSGRENKIDIRDFAPGIYLLQYKTQAGTKNQKIVKTH